MTIRFFQRNRPLVTRLKNVRGEVLLDEVSSATGRPLVVRAAAGLGQVTFVGIDLDHPSLKDWKGRPRLVGRAAASAARPSASRATAKRAAASRTWATTT